MTDGRIHKLLIANRGEIACRIIRSCQQLGISTVAIYAAADSQAQHVTLADEAWLIAAETPLAPYLDIPAILQIAKRSGAEAIHPGYGFLSENADFARACEQQHLVFVGPPASAIEAMGSKSAAKQLMAAAGVPLIPGYHGDQQQEQQLLQQAQQIGFPVLIKAALGGGGKGMRVVTAAAQFGDALAAAKREAKAAFADDKVLLERYLPQSRHIEVQIFADNDGHCIYLGDRDCSLQRRHQKVMEEAPAPGLSDALRQQMGNAAVKAASAIGYRGAGTIEFLLDDQQQFYFMEMNTRLQVEHPVTELVTGQDLVAWQLAIAAGQPLPLSQAEVQLNGHAIEARIYAEDPCQQFLPAAGPLHYLQEPPPRLGLRLDTGVRQGDHITPYYDPMIAKLICWAPQRQQALQQLQQALTQYQIAGVHHNIAFLAAICRQPQMRQAQVHTHFIEQHSEWLLTQAAPPAPGAEVLAAVAMILRLSNRAASDCYPWQQLAGFRLNGPSQWQFNVAIQLPDGPRRYLLTLQQSAPQGEYSLTVISTGEAVFANRLIRGEINGQQLRLDVATHPWHCHFYQHQTRLYLLRDGHVWQFDCGPQQFALTEQQNDKALCAPMNGTIVTLLVPPGSAVSRGTGLLVLEAMKMEYQINAPQDGTVTEFLYQPGQLVTDGELLLQFTPKAVQ